MIKHRVPPLVIRCLFLGIAGYFLYYVLTLETLYDAVWSDVVIRFPLFYLIVTMSAVLYSVIKGAIQLRKQGTSGKTAISIHVRGGFLITGLLLIGYNHLFRVPSLLTPVSWIMIFFYDLPGIYWLIDTILFEDAGNCKVYSPFLWLLVQVFGYIGIILIQAQSSKTIQPYVYDILDIKHYGLAGVGKNVAVISAIYLFFSYLFYGIDRLAKPNDPK